MIANSYIDQNQISKPDINDDHELLRHVSESLQKDIKQIISEAVNLSLDSAWVRSLKALIEKPRYHNISS